MAEEPVPMDKEVFLSWNDLLARHQATLWEAILPDPLNTLEVYKSQNSML